MEVVRSDSGSSKHTNWRYHTLSFSKVIHYSLNNLPGINSSPTSFSDSKQKLSKSGSAKAARNGVTLARAEWIAHASVPCGKVSSGGLTSESILGANWNRSCGDVAGRSSELPLTWTGVSEPASGPAAGTRLEGWPSSFGLNSCNCVRVRAVHSHDLDDVLDRSCSATLVSRQPRDLGATG